MAKIRADLEGVTHVHGDSGDVIVLSAGDTVPDGYTVGEHLLDATDAENETKAAAKEGKGSGSRAPGKAAKEAKAAAAKETTEPTGDAGTATGDAGDAGAADDAKGTGDDGGLAEPPRGGAGSGIDAWREYADAVGVEYTDETSREDIIAAVDASKA